jgi:RNA polymerase sigma-70 factor, ECF subfamily
MFPVMTLRALERVSTTSDAWDWHEMRAHCLVVARRFLRGPAAEDAAQEAVLRAWRMRTRVAVRDPKAWLTRIARNEALRLAARESVLSGRHTGTDVELVAGEGWERDVRDRLAASSALAALPLADREVLHLRYLEDLTQTEVAHRLGIPEGTAKVRLHRARKRLEREMRKGRP